MRKFSNKNKFKKKEFFWNKRSWIIFLITGLSIYHTYTIGFSYNIIGNIVLIASAIFTIAKLNNQKKAKKMLKSQKKAKEQTENGLLVMLVTIIVFKTIIPIFI